jgi:hypothetical protein
MDSFSKAKLLWSVQRFNGSRFEFGNRIVGLLIFVWIEWNGTVMCVVLWSGSSLWDINELSDISVE